VERSKTPIAIVAAPIDYSHGAKATLQARRSDVVVEFRTVAGYVTVGQHCGDCGNSAAHGASRTDLCDALKRVNAIGQAIVKDEASLLRDPDDSGWDQRPIVAPMQA
jgi:hypothetical protein